MCIINPRCACAARVTVVGLSVCLSVCRRLFWHYRLLGGLLAIPASSELCEPENQKGDFPETTAFERYAVKTSEKANMHNSAGLPPPDPLALCTLEAQEVQRRACIDSSMLSASPCQHVNVVTLETEQPAEFFCLNHICSASIT